MTRASRKIEKDGVVLERPTRRIVDSQHGELVAELTDRTLTLRPKGARRNGPSEYAVTFGQVYQRAVEDAVLRRMRERQKARKAGRRA